MRFTVLWALNVLVDVAVLCLFALYGRLHWWWVRYARLLTEPPPRSVSQNFWATLENIHVLCVVLGALVLAANLYLLRRAPVKSWFGVGATLLSVLVVLVCVVVAV